MTDMNITARFKRTRQPAPYESVEAEVSVVGAAGEEGFAATIGKYMDQAKIAVLDALANPDGVAIRGETAAGTEPAKRGPGRPRKDAAAPAPEKIASEFDAQPKGPEPDAVGEATGVETGDAPPVADSELQTACSKAAAKIGKDGPASIRKLYDKKYGVGRVAAIKQELRRAFLADLDTIAKGETERTAFFAALQ